MSLLMDVRMPELDGIEATRRIVADPATAGVRVLVLTTFDLDEYVYAALRAGASGFLLKDATPEDLRRGDPGGGRRRGAARAVGDPPAGRASSPGALRAGGRAGAAGRLTEREREVLRARRAGPVQRRDRRAARREPGDREDARQPDPHQARRCATAPSWSCVAYEAGLVVPGAGELTGANVPRRTPPGSTSRADILAADVADAPRRTPSAPLITQRSTPMTRIDLDHLTKRYGAVTAVDDLNFEPRARARSPASSAPTAPASPPPCGCCSG